MPTATLLLVLTSAFAHALWNALLKRCKNPEDATVAMGLAGGAASLFVALLLRAPFPSGWGLVWTLVSGALETAYFVTLAYALARAPLGSVYTVVRGGALVLVWPVSVLALGEHVTAFALMGTATLLCGLAAAGMGSGPSSDRARSGLVVAAPCACFVAGYNLSYKVALSHGSSPAAVNALSLSTASLLNVAFKWQRRQAAFEAFKAEPFIITLGGVLAGLGFLIFLIAMRQAGAGIVLTLRNTSILFAQLMAFAVGERPRRIAVIGAVLVTAGAVLLAL